MEFRIWSVGPLLTWEWGNGKDEGKDHISQGLVFKAQGLGFAGTG